MKKKMIAMLLAVTMMLTVFAGMQISASAADKDIWKYDINDSGVEITGCFEPVGDLIIPDTLSGYPVTSIGDYAFSNETSITSIIIPNTVTRIGNEAFNGCTSLTSITIPDSVMRIGYRAFANTGYYNNVGNWENGVLYIGNHLITAQNIANDEYAIKSGTVSLADEAFSDSSKLTSVTIPDSVTSIGKAFYQCAGLTSVTIPDRVTSIPDHAFSACYSLASITIPDSVTCIGDGAFEYCESLTSITIPGSVTSIGYEAFYWCDGLTSLTILEDVKSIGNKAFCQCFNLASITLPDSVTNIGEAAFSGTEYVDDADNWENGALYIGNHLISTSNDLPSEYAIKEGTKSIAANAFEYRDLTSVTIPDSLTSIGDAAFYGCGSLFSLIIPDSVTSIGDSAFYYCSKLFSVTIPAHVSYIGSEAFCDCTGLISITIPDSVKNIGAGAFSNTGYYNNQGNWVDGALYIGNHLIATSYDLPGEYAVKEGTKSIAANAFEYRGLSSITIPESVTSIGTDAFYRCDNLTIYGYAGSYAETYASENEIPFVAISLNLDNGDVDGDGKTNVSDIIKVKNLIMAGEWTSSEQTAGDLNGNGKLDVADIIAIKNKIMGA